MRPQKLAIISTASGCGKTTLGRALAATLDATYVELDALVHGPHWTEMPDEKLRAAVAPLLEHPRWVVDGNYRKKLGDLVFARAELVVWLDLPLHVWFPRLLARTWRRWWRDEVLWNGNRESLRDVFWGKDSLFAYALRTYRQRQREFPDMLAPYAHVRLCSVEEVARFEDSVADAVWPCVVSSSLTVRDHHRTSD